MTNKGGNRIDSANAEDAGANPAPSTIDKIYAAGYIEADGCITLSHTGKTRKFRYPVVSMTTTDYEIANWFKEIFGGWSVSCKVYAAHHKQRYEWRIESRKAIKFLQIIRPYMKMRRKIDRADMLINEYEKITPRNGKYSAIQIKIKKEFEEKFHSIS